MKLQLDTAAKTVKVEGEVNLAEFIKTMKALLPDGAWEKYSLLANTTIVNWQNPIVIKEPYIVRPDPYPWWTPQVTYETTTGPMYEKTVTGTYCIEV